MPDNQKRMGFVMDKAEIEAVIQTYFDGSYELDKEKARAAFHPDAHIYLMSGDGALGDLTVEGFVAIFDNLDSPESAEQGREDRILSIDVTGEHTAVARVTLRIAETVFTDILGFVSAGGRWRIITKISSGVKQLGQ